MKIRNGFVSNSSSTAFILDARKLDQTTLQRLRSLPDMDLLDRCTAYCDDAQTFVDDRKAYFKGYQWGDTFGAWIQKWIDKLGNENVLLVRESDEEMGGSFSDVDLSYGEVEQLAEDEMEYH